MSKPCQKSWNSEQNIHSDLSKFKTQKHGKVIIINNRLLVKSLALTTFACKSKSECHLAVKLPTKSSFHMSKFQQSYLKPCDFQFTKSLKLNKFKTSQKHPQKNLVYLNNKSMFCYKNLQILLGSTNFQEAKRRVDSRFHFGRNIHGMIIYIFCY